MLERLAPAGIASIALGLALIAASPARSQTAAEAATEKPPAAAEQPSAATANAAPAPTAEQPTPVAAETPPPPPVDPVLAEIRRQLTESAKGDVDRAALAAFYGARNEPPLWVGKEGFTAKARHATAEIAKADDWGLVAGAFELPQLAQGETSSAALAGAEIKLGLAVLKYARHARGGRIDPSQLSRHLDMKPTLREPKVVLDAVAATDAPGDYLRDLHPKHVQFQRLREALLKARSPAKEETVKEAPVRLPPDGPLLRPGMEHPDVALLRRRLEVAAEAGRENVFDPALEAAVFAFQRERKMSADGLVGRGTRAALNGEPKPALAGSEVQRLIANMERWRWMPENLGEMHVWDNIPEFMTRVLKKGQMIHTAKIIVGKPATPTAVFSAPMKFLVFHPEWGVPDSIKLKELAPYLNSSGGFFLFGGSDTSILSRQRMRVVYNGRVVDASSVDWGSVDIRRYSFVQSAGAHNVLGVVKFMFPNKHDIYMHDTPQRELFEHPVRLFSHGCIRVHNPARLAELLLAEDKDWPAEQVRGLLARGNNTEVQLQRQVPVHVTYFTAVAGENGQVTYFGDVYGHDNRVLAALGGKPLPQDLGPGDQQYREVRRPQRYKQTSNDFFSGLFGN